MQNGSYKFIPKVFMNIQRVAGSCSLNKEGAQPCGTIHNRCQQPDVTVLLIFAMLGGKECI